MVLWLMAVAHWASAAQVRPEVLAQGDSERLWVAQVRQAGPAADSVQTIVYYRVFGQGDKWQVLARLPARAINLAGQESQAGILLDDGTWVLVYTDSTVVTAGALPDSARMVALAASGNAWWAVGAVRGGLASVIAKAATRGAATAPVAVASQPFETRLVLFRLTGNQWMPLSELPDDASADPNVSLALVDDVPHVAVMIASGALAVRHLADRRWVNDLTLGDLPSMSAFKLLSDGSLPRLWVGRLTDADLLYVLKSPQLATIKLKPIPATTPAQRTVAIALGKLSMFATGQGKLQEQDFPLDGGLASGPPYNLSVPRGGSLKQLERVQWVAVSAALLLAMLSSVRQWPASRRLASELGEITLAPVGRRLLAGIIDAAPVALAAITAAWIGSRRTPGSETPDLPGVVLVVYWAAGLFYVLWMTIIESLAGRSPGKVLTRLRIVGLDGKAAKPAALVTRNALRLIDVVLFLFPLLLIPASPLRQRFGDVAAGTLVVADTAGEKQVSEQDRAVDKTDVKS